MRDLTSNIDLGDITGNVGLLLQGNCALFENNIVYQEKGEDGQYHGISWKDFYRSIENIAFNLSELGFSNGDKMVLFSRNRLEMLQLELAVIASGGIAVPIFSNFKQETAELLIRHSDAEYLAVAGDHQLNNLTEDIVNNSIIVFDDITHFNYHNLIPFTDLLKERKGFCTKIDLQIPADTVCLNMYTSGTMGTPKCVQLTHKNILSQQAAIDLIWDLDESDRFLSYLPWHHSFGGIFELFTALYHGATISLESSYGKDAEAIMANWADVRPTVFFSVPKVYQSLVELTRGSKEAENMFFNSGLQFVFTAAASLPERISNEFERRGITVIEGWGLTETSPCCTLTDPDKKRVAGLVGNPIPGVSIRIADDNEILIKGPNVMPSYYKNYEANEIAFTSDGWYKTGDVGAVTDDGLKLISRKDRIFKLSNGEKVVPTDLEKAIELKCHYVSYAIVSGSGKEHPVALIFPNKNLLDKPDYELTPNDGCFCPRNLNELGRCLNGCLHDANSAIGQKFAKIRSAVVIDGKLSLDDSTLTPSMKVAPKNVVTKYKDHLLNLYGDNVPVEEEVYMIELGSRKIK